MSPLEELMEMAKNSKRRKIYVISTDYVIQKLKEHSKLDAAQSS